MIGSIENKELGGVAPSEYRKKMRGDKISEILTHAMCPEELFEDDFESFRERRAELLKERADALMNQV
ncbi:hypothetical protein ACUH91_08095 [Dermabacteraceae bacterium P9123]